MKSGIHALWTSDRRAPCGEAWLLDHAPEHTDAPNSPLGRARMAMRALLDDAPLERAQSLSLGRQAGLPEDVWRAHCDLLGTLDLPDGFADPWLKAWHGVQLDDPQAASRLLAWSIWDPDEDRRLHLFEDIELHLERDIECQDSRCLWKLADELAGEEGVVGRRDALSDPLWLRSTGPRLAGVAGDWVAEWRVWVDGDPALRRAVVRTGVGDEPASALWVGGNFTGRTLLEAELGFSDPSAIEPLLPRAVASDTAGGRAAALIPW